MLLGAAARDTETVRLGLSATHVYLREPTLIAQALATLDELTGGRAEAVVSFGYQTMLDAYHVDWRGGRPLARVREAIGVMRSYLDEGEVSHEGEFFRYSGVSTTARPVQQRLPLLIGAIGGPRSFQLAGEVADGVQAVGCSRENAEYVVEHVAKGAERAGRDWRRLDAATACVVTVAEESAAAKEVARLIVGTWLATMPRSVVERHGLDPDEVGQLGSATTRGYADVACAARDCSRFRFRCGHPAWVSQAPCTVEHMYDSKERMAPARSGLRQAVGDGRGSRGCPVPSRGPAYGRAGRGWPAGAGGTLAREHAGDYRPSGPGPSASAPSLEEALEVLAAALDRLAAVDLDSAGDRAVLDAAVRCQRLANQHAGVGLGLLDEIARRQAHEVDGAVTAASWYRNRVGMDPAEATRRVRAATRLRRLPALADALAAGDVTLEHVTAITDAATPARMEAVAAFDQTLAELAARAQPRDVRTALRRIRDAADPDGSDPPPPPTWGDDERRYFSLNRTIDGLWRTDGLLDPLCGEALATLLEAYRTQDSADTPFNERRSAGQQRHDALAAAIRDLLDHGQAPTVAGNKPHLLAVVDIATLLGQDPEQPTDDFSPRPTGDERATPHESGTTAPPEARTTAVRQPRLRYGSHITGHQARVLAQDAKITAVLTMGPWRAVSVGRTMRTLPNWLRPLSEMIHRHCRGPDCDRPAAWTEAHHQHAWADGGHTDLNSTIPLCHAHHDLVTSKGWHATFNPDTGICTWTGPQGQRIETPAPDP